MACASQWRSGKHLDAEDFVGGGIPPSAIVEGCGMICTTWLLSVSAVCFAASGRLSGSPRAQLDTCRFPAWRGPQINTSQPVRWRKSFPAEWRQPCCRWCL
ncbi:hypothetical protein MPLSOD_330063 [Mesorhizobium sp. SOD10]|nr:hypothetical protein MPLSOD_330063 [Mesorhizobium sp. SOD10]